ncbi:MAG: beta-N-acetylhexosaminidase [Acidobacteria bacterium]|nr:beta-N-acetylhexosaminidase [Acidobacteriota bacterium]
MPHTLSRSLARRLSLLAALSFSFAFAARAQTPGAPHPSPPFPEIHVIPAPRELTAAGGRFEFTRDARVALADPRADDDRFAAEDFIEDARAAANLALKLAGRRDRATILVGSLDLSAIQSALRRAGVEVPPSLNEEGYVLVASPREIVVAGKSAAGTFYGLQTLKQLVRGEGDAAFVPAVTIVDYPAMRWRGVFDDINRGPVPTLDYMKRQIRTEAAFKLNMHAFNMENIVRFESQPLLGPEGGALTPAEIRELVTYARRYHVELVPQQQTFGHLHKVLSLEKYAPLGELPYGDVLSPQQEGTYKLIADWYGELNELFPGRFFHVGEDEVGELSQGQSNEAVRAKGVGEVYFGHLRRVAQILKPYNRRLMFWGDIALTHPDLIGSVPKDMIAMNWSYGAREDFRGRIKPFKDAGLEQFVCPGVQTWSQIFPNDDAAVKNIVNFVRDGQEAGALGMLNTEWDDDGESLFENAWYGVVLGAAASWQEGQLDVDRFERDFDWAYFRADGDQFVRSIRSLGSVNTLMGAGSTDQLFWQEPFTSAFQAQARKSEDKTKQMRLVVEGVEETLRREGARARRNREAIPTMIFAARRFDHMGRRMEVVGQFSRDYWAAYLNLGDRVRVNRLRRYNGAVYNSLREMAEELSLLREGYRERWLAENRPYWLQSILARYDRMISVWLNKSQALEEALRGYAEHNTLPDPEQFGLGARPQP